MTTITRDDIEAKAQQLVGAVEDTGESVKNIAVIAAVTVGVAIAAAFIIGRRRGLQNKTVVEVYRV